MGRLSGPSLSIGSLLASPFSRIAVAVFLALGSAYLAAVAIAALAAARRFSLELWPGVARALITMHMAYGSGFLIGIFTHVLPRTGNTWFSKLSR